MNESAFGSYIRKMRLAAGLSLRKVADKLPFGYVYLGEVERGVRGPIPKEHWGALIAAIPGVTLDDLEQVAASTRPIQLNLADAPPRYQELGLALARRIEERSLGDPQLADLLAILKGKKP